MRRMHTKKASEPSKASLAEMPEVDFAKPHVRGRHVGRARRSLEVLVVDKKTVKTLGGPEAVVTILQTLAASIEPKRKKGHAA